MLRKKEGHPSEEFPQEMGNRCTAGTNSLWINVPYLGAACSETEQTIVLDIWGLRIAWIKAPRGDH